MAKTSNQKGKAQERRRLLTAWERWQQANSPHREYLTPAVAVALYTVKCSEGVQRRLALMAAIESMATPEDREEVILAAWVAGEHALVTDERDPLDRLARVIRVPP